MVSNSLQGRIQAGPPSCGDLIRARKAENILWGFNGNNFDLLTTWNAMTNSYPGASYVDWLGLSVYGKMIKSEG